MPTRTIKTVDGTEHSGDSSDFTDYYSHVEYRNSSETKVIYQNNIIYDATTTNWSERMMPLKIGIITGIITFFLLWFAFEKVTGSEQTQSPTVNKEKTIQVVTNNTQSKSEPVVESKTQKATKDETQKPVVADNTPIKSEPVTENDIQKTVAKNQTLKTIAQKAAKNQTLKTVENEIHQLERQELQKFLEQEVRKLFVQQYIDPLTDYIIKYQEDSLRKPYMQSAIEERNRRCAEIEKRFQKKPKNYWTLAKLTKNYNYSCPDVVNRFAQRI